mgnify:FL=1
MDKFYQSLLKVKTKSVQNKKPKNEYLTLHTVREIHKFLRSAFNQAVKWELMTRNPVLNATLPKEEHQKREIWTAETLMYALEVCDDDILSLAINLSFACSLRMGEMLGLTWDCVDISEKSLRDNNASIYVDKELQRLPRSGQTGPDSGKSECSRGNQAFPSVRAGLYHGKWQTSRTFSGRNPSKRGICANAGIRRKRKCGGATKKSGCKQQPGFHERCDQTCGGADQYIFAPAGI